MNADTRVFLAGLAAEPRVLQAILGQRTSIVARADGLVLVAADQGPWPIAVAEPGTTEGVILDLDAKAFADLDFVLCSLGLHPHTLHSPPATTYVGTVTPGAREVLSKAGPEVLDVVVALIGDIMAMSGQARPEAIAGRLHPMLVRAAARLRAADAPPATLRHSTGPGDVTIKAQRQPYGSFFAIAEYDVRWRRFNGQASETVTRAALVSGDAVTVLPYDPVRDRVLVVEQFRAGPLARGDAQVWQIEAIAGRVDPFETPEVAARREAEEEAGLILHDLIPVSRFYPSPGAVTEYIYSYVALTDLPDGIAGVFGVAGEAEDIRGHLISFDHLMDLVASGEIETAPLILTALWLQRERARLR